MNIRLAALIVITIFWNVLSCMSKQAVIPVDNFPYIERTEPSRAEQVMNALLEAYPDRIERVEFRNDDWAVLLGDTWFYFAGGRLLPENRLEHAAFYRSYQFYSYPAELPPWTEFSPEEIERFRLWTNTRSQNQIRRGSYFLDALWQASNRAEAESQQVRINFLGWSPKVHNLIQEQTARVNERIREAAKTDPELQAWINNIGTLDGYNWRNVADTQSRSYHSYGIAIDILPKSLDNMQTYWLWTLREREDWWNVSYDERYHPPAAVIKAFEDYGFIWGGKWSLFDTMHFEYRPEILILNGMTIIRE